MEVLTPQNYREHYKQSESGPKEMVELTKNYNKAVKENIPPEQIVIKNVSKQNPKHYSKEKVS